MKEYFIDFGIILHCSAKAKGDSIKEAYDNEETIIKIKKELLKNKQKSFWKEKVLPTLLLNIMILITKAE